MATPKRLRATLASRAPAVFLLLFFGVRVVLFIRDRYHRAWENAVQSACPHNLKQLGIAILQYRQDYDEVLPPSCVADSAHPDPADRVAAITWDELLQPYVKRSGTLSPESFHCRLDP